MFATFEFASNFHLAPIVGSATLKLVCCTVRYLASSVLLFLSFFTRIQKISSVIIFHYINQARRNIGRAGGAVKS